MIMISLNNFIKIDWAKIWKATSENKKECIEFVKKYIQLGLEYRSYGIDVFIKEHKITDSIFERIALEMRINGDCEEYTVSVLSNIMHSTSFEPLEYLFNIIIFQFIVLEYEESVPIHILVKMLGSILGTAIFNELLIEYGEYFH